jgi:cobalamin synthase
MGYYYEQRPPGAEKGPGCLDALVITRVVFGMLFWPLAALILVFVDLGVIFYFFTLHPALALIPLAWTAAGIWLFARWEQRRIRGINPHDPGDGGRINR